jgi:hypothetical protein
MRPLRVTELGRLPDGGVSDGGVSHRGLSGQCVPVGIGVGHLVGAGEDDARSTQMAFAACLGVLRERAFLNIDASAHPLRAADQHTDRIFSDFPKERLFLDVRFGIAITGDLCSWDSGTAVRLPRRQNPQNPRNCASLNLNSLVRSSGSQRGRDKRRAQPGARSVSNQSGQPIRV